MPKTAYSNRFIREVDAFQFLALVQGVQPGRLDPKSDIASAVRAFARGDVVCSSCGVAGAQIVRPATGTKGQILRQAHFRFASDAGQDLHHRFCEFAGEDATNIKRNDALIDFGKSKTQETEAIRLLVCKGIAGGHFDAATIRTMRQWFFDLKVAHRFKVTATPAIFDWLSILIRTSFGMFDWEFAPEYGELPNYNWREAAQRAFATENKDLLAALKALAYPALRRGKVLAAQHIGEDAFDPSVLESYYAAALDLATFLSVNGGIPWGNVKPNAYRWKGASGALLALSALLLFRTQWDKAAAIRMFSAIAAAPTPGDLTLGNVIGLNPFHDYPGWKAVRLASTIPSNRAGGFNYFAELKAIEDALRARHKRWAQENAA